MECSELSGSFHPVTKEYLTQIANRKQSGKSFGGSCSPIRRFTPKCFLCHPHLLYHFPSMQPYTFELAPIGDEGKDGSMLRLTSYQQSG